MISLQELYHLRLKKGVGATDTTPFSNGLFKTPLGIFMIFIDNL